MASSFHAYTLYLRGVTQEDKGYPAAVQEHWQHTNTQTGCVKMSVMALQRPRGVMKMCEMKTALSEAGAEGNTRLLSALCFFLFSFFFS